MRLFFLPICLLFSYIICSQNEKTTTIYLIRHCEKEAGLTDPELSEMGKLRAENWKNYFDKLPIDNFYTTATKRTATTCSIIADSKKKEIQFYNHNDFSLNEIIKIHQGKTILIVGHSNTIPIVVNTYLGEEIYPIFSENEYGCLFIITTQGNSIKHELKYLNN